MKNLIQKYRKYIPAIIFSIMVLAIGYLLLPDSDWSRYFAPAAPVQVSVVSLGIIDKPAKVFRTGIIGKSSNIPINAEYSGGLIEIYVTEGQAVKAGQPLFKLEAAYGERANTNSSASAVSPQLQNRYDNALKEFNRYQALYDQGAVSRRQLEAASARLKEVEANLANGSGNMPAGNGHALVLQGAATVTAPIDGIVTGLAAASGQSVQAGQQLLALGGGQEFEVVVQLAQDDLNLVQLGTEVIVDLPGQAMTGQISSIYPVVEADPISFLAHIKIMDKPVALLNFGSAIGVHIDSGEMISVAALPNTAISHDEQGKSFIYAAVNGKAVRQEINVGETLGEFTEITSPMGQGIQVVSSNIDELKNGSAIAIR
ncbi:efflux RND transporter periplasmic adaptor subunit [bacterium BFN5]|nr:efflux RND transporter periplasmic adaptor subunit [bacterium BFN5]QJW45725.1 efflux RND transporter periplasmic adaptor subunit [bacterium BFN5]